MPQSSSTAAKRLFAIGDIHGCWKPLEALLETVRPSLSDVVVVLGDFINRGASTPAVLDRLIQLAGQTQLVLVLGNHEEELLAATEDKGAFGRWLHMGGRETLRSYLAYSGHADELGPLTPDHLKFIPAGHWQLLRSAVEWWECEDFFFTHAGYDPDLPLSEQSAYELRWMSLGERTLRPHCCGKTAIVGHTPNLAGRILDFGFLRCLDTGCGLGGYLTVMEVYSRQAWQCAEHSEKVVWL